MTAAAVAHHAGPAPRPPVPTGDRRFATLLAGCLGAVIAAAAFVSGVDLPQPEPTQAEPEPLTVVWVAPKPVPPPPKPKPKPKPPRPKAKAPEVPPEPIAESLPAPEPESVASVRERAREAGVLAFADVLADLRAETETSEIEETEIIQRGPGDAPRLERSILTSAQSKAPPVDVNVTEFARVSGGVALAGRKTTKVEALPEDRSPSGRIGARRVTVSERPVRSIEEIRRVFDANKGAIFALYNRALRKQPGIAGKVVLELVIEPSGRVAGCRVVSSEIDQPDLVDRLVRRVGMFDFGAKQVERTTVTYPVHFLPS